MISTCGHMEHLKATVGCGFVELEIANKCGSVQSLLDAQRELVHQQIDELQRIVALQCRLTGINPLSQEMAAGALSIKIGRRPRDLLTPKAIKCLQGIFAIKDTITKREAREISALCGATITQVREFFSGQRSRVRRFLRQSHDKTNNMQTGNTTQGDDPSSTKQPGPVSVALHSQIGVVNRVTVRDIFRLPNDDTLRERESFDSNFIKSFFFLMRKESTFSGQVQLLEQILQIHDSTVLCWFVTKGGIPILSKWLCQASIEEQTTVLNIIFKVLCHLPLHKALPVQMSTILQSVNKLRFYRTSDISNRARILLARWSKMFVRSQGGGRKAISTGSAVHAQKGLQGQQDFLAKRRGDDLSVQATDTINKRTKTSSTEGSEEYTKKTLTLTLPSVHSPRQPRLLQSSVETLTSSEASKKRPVHSIPLDQTKERRKVLLVEEPKHISSGRKVNTRSSTCKNSSRPLSTDDIQKAKRRTLLLQSTHGRVDVLKLDDLHLEPKTSESTCCFTHLGEDHERVSRSKDNTQAADILGPPLQGSRDIAEAVNDSITIKDNLAEETRKHIPTHNSSWSKIEQFKEIQVSWVTPQEIRVDPVWRVARGEESKEVEFQSERVKREKEAVYSTEESIPSDPKEPWDIELDYDDSLTPEIPLEPIVTDDSPKIIPAGTDEMEQHRESRNGMKIGESSALFPYFVESNEKACSGMHNPAEVAEASPCMYSNSNSTQKIMRHVTSTGDSGPDLELLAVLLKNPDLVFALTSDQGASLSKVETMALLDLLKMSSIKQESFGGATNFSSNKQNGVSSMVSENLEVLKLERLKDAVSSPQLTPVKQSVHRLAEPISIAVVPSIDVSQSSHLAPTNAFYEGGYAESRENGVVSDFGLHKKQNFSLYTNDSSSQFLPAALDNHQAAAQEPREHLYESENGWSQQGTARVQQEIVKPPSLGFPVVHTALTADKDLQTNFVRTSGPSQPPTWPVATGQKQLKVVNAKIHGGVSSTQSVTVEHSSLQANNRPTSDDMPVARFALKRSLLNGTNRSLVGVVSTAQSFPQQNTSQGSNRSLAASLLNGQPFVKNSPMQQGNMRVPNSPVAPLPTTSRMQTSSQTNVGFTEGVFSEMRDHHSLSSSVVVPPGAFKGKGNSSSFDRVRSLVMDFGRDTGRDHAKNNYLPHSQGHGPRPDILPPLPSYPNRMLPPVQPNFVRSEPIAWICPKAPTGNYSQGHVSMIDIVPPRTQWRPDIRGDHPSPLFHQVHDPFPRMPLSGPSNHPGNLQPRSPWGWAGKGGSSRPGRR